MRIEIKPEAIVIEREQQEYEAVLGRCDVCKAHPANWEVVYAWQRAHPYTVPSLVTHAFICEPCHVSTIKTREFIRAFLERQANYRANRIRQEVCE